MAFFEDILTFKREDEDYYQILGCDETSSMEQICTEYKNRALIYHPDKNSGCETKAAQFQMLQTAKETLTDPTKRKAYDAWRRSGLAISFDQWMGRRQQSPATHWADRKKKDLMLSMNHDQDEFKKSESEDVLWLPDRKNNQSELLKKFRSYEI
uniref:J domain-containing protein n=1 Tax=Strigamia maritima TaxID=126957 RepID=T1JMM2_STRMM